MNVNLPNWTQLGKVCKDCGLPKPEIRETADKCVPNYEVEIPGYYKRAASVTDYAIDAMMIWVEGYAAAIRLYQGTEPAEPEELDQYLFLARDLAETILRDSTKAEPRVLARAIVNLTKSINSGRENHES